MVPVSPPRERMLLLTHAFTAAWSHNPGNGNHKPPLVWGTGLKRWLLLRAALPTFLRDRRFCPPAAAPFCAPASTPPCSVETGAAQCEGRASSWFSPQIPGAGWGALLHDPGSVVHTGQSSGRIPGPGQVEPQGEQCGKGARSASGGRVRAGGRGALPWGLPAVPSLPLPPAAVGPGQLRSFGAPVGTQLPAIPGHLVWVPAPPGTGHGLADAGRGSRVQGLGALLLLALPGIPLEQGW